MRALERVRRSVQVELGSHSDRAPNGFVVAAEVSLESVTEEGRVGFESEV